ncbi:DUF4389 domain-containing protein [Teredinibacter turnerae]|uniref:DUF4389 domain-containing protein n=1 Tax=Teredinibacter turnerae TaxID=2426 RepID=UPI00037E0749|nr:DUF4389 domain-containing protein [Teredinibacter turnerae]
MQTQNSLDQDDIHNHLRNQQAWLRLLYMLLFAALLNLAAGVMWVICLLQFIFVVTTGEDNSQLRHFARSLSQFIHRALLFVSYNSDEKPFPFAPWPDASPVQQWPADNRD